MEYLILNYLFGFIVGCWITIYGYRKYYERFSMVMEDTWYKEFKSCNYEKVLTVMQMAICIYGGFGSVMFIPLVILTHWFLAWRAK